MAFANTAQKRREFGNGTQRRCIREDGVGGSNVPCIPMPEGGSWKRGGAVMPALRGAASGDDVKSPATGSTGVPGSRTQAPSSSQMPPGSREMSPRCCSGAAHADGTCQGPASQPVVHSSGVPPATPSGPGRVTGSVHAQQHATGAWRRACGHSRVPVSAGDRGDTEGPLLGWHGAEHCSAWGKWK